MPLGFVMQLARTSGDRSSRTRAASTMLGVEARQANKRRPLRGLVMLSARIAVYLVLAVTEHCACSDDADADPHEPALLRLGRHLVAEKSQITRRALKSGQGTVPAGGTEGLIALHGMTNIVMVLLVYTKCENVKDGWKNVIVRAAFAAPRFSLR